MDQFPRDEIPSILRRARENTVGVVITVGTTLQSSRVSVALAQQYDGVYAGIGLHPMDLTGPIDAATYRDLMDLGVREPCVVALSEVGLDYTAGYQPREVQQDAFRVQIQLARSVGLPIIFHSRNAGVDTLRLLEEERADQVGGAWHYFLGEEDLAHRALEMGFLLSLAPNLLHLPQLQRVVSLLPLEVLLLESDAFPQPWKSRRDRWAEPWRVRTVAEKLAELKSLSELDIRIATTSNLLRMIGHRLKSTDDSTSENSQDSPRISLQLD